MIKNSKTIIYLFPTDPSFIGGSSEYCENIREIFAHINLPLVVKHFSGAGKLHILLQNIKSLFFVITNYLKGNRIVITANAKFLLPIIVFNLLKLPFVVDFRF